MASVFLLCIQELAASNLSSENYYLLSRLEAPRLSLSSKICQMVLNIGAPMCEYQLQNLSTCFAFRSSHI
jgi:hypothetical protein